MRCIKILISMILSCESYAISTLHIDEVIGKAKFRRDISSYWINLEDKNSIPEDSLLFLDENSSVKFTKKTPLESKKFEIKGPTVMRLKRFLLRKKKIHKIFLESAYENSPAVKQDTGAVKTDFFDQAVKFFATIAPGSDDQKSRFAKKTQVNASKTIQLFVPTNNEVIGGSSENDKPIYFFWSKTPRKQDKYLIYIWPIGEERNEPLAVVQQNFYHHKLHNHGKYQAQITSLDGEYQSNIINFKLLDHSQPLTKSEIISRQEQGYFPITLTHPMTRYHVWAADKTKVHFQWELEPGYNLKKFTLIIKDKKSQKQWRIKSGNNMFKALNLPAGDYTWYVIGDINDPVHKQETIKVTSRFREISIASWQQKSTKSKKKMMQRILKSKHDHHIYIDKI